MGPGCRKQEEDKLFDSPPHRELRGLQLEIVSVLYKRDWRLSLALGSQEVYTVTSEGTIDFPSIFQDQ